MTAFRVSGYAAPPLELIVNGEPILAREGDTVAAALLAAGHWTFRRNHGGAVRGPYCAMGACQECLVEIDGVANRRACLHPVAPGMKVTCG